MGGLGAPVCICFVYLGLDLRAVYGFCALLQRMGISGIGPAKQIPRGNDGKKGKCKKIAGICGFPPMSR